MTAPSIAQSPPQINLRTLAETHAAHRQRLLAEADARAAQAAAQAEEERWSERVAVFRDLTHDRIGEALTPERHLVIPVPGYERALAAWSDGAAYLVMVSYARLDCLSPCTTCRAGVAIHEPFDAAELLLQLTDGRCVACAERARTHPALWPIHPAPALDTCP